MVGRSFIVGVPLFVSVGNNCRRIAGERNRRSNGWSKTKPQLRYVTDNGEPLAANMTTSLLKGSQMNYELACQSIPSADVPGYRFTCDHNGRTIARCMACRVGFVVREDDAVEVRCAMRAHRDLSHGGGR
jgi:hypothetical protein